MLEIGFGPVRRRILASLKRRLLQRENGFFRDAENPAMHVTRAVHVRKRQELQLAGRCFGAE